MPASRIPSPLDEAVRRVGDRWTLLIVEALLERPLRFGELRERLPDIASNVLSQRLRHLEQEGLVLARAYSQRPPRAVYELTEDGRELSGALRLLADWGSRRGGEPLRHAVCGSALEARWYCPTCGVVSDEDGTELYQA